MSAPYSIGQLARHFGVTHRTIRFYEDKGLLSSSRARDSGYSNGSYRIYTEAEKARLAMILNAKKMGFTLSDIRDLIGPDNAIVIPPKALQQQISFLEQQRVEIEAALLELRQQAA